METTNQIEQCDKKTALFNTAKALLSRASHIEIRALHVPDKDGAETTVFAVCNDPEHAAKWAAKLERRCAEHGKGNVYLSIHEFSGSHARHAGQPPRQGRCLTDAQVDEYLWLPVDVDPVRRCGEGERDCEAASEAEKEKAYNVMMAVIGYLKDECGWPSPLLADSGNGYHALFPLRLPASDRHLIQQALRTLDARFSTEDAHVDTTCSNPSRILRYYGTTNRKGAPSEARPHRESHLIDVPEALIEASREQIEALAAHALEKPTKRERPDRPMVQNSLEKGAWWRRLKVPRAPRREDGNGYGRAALEREVNQLRETPEGGRNWALLNAGLRMGSLVGSRDLGRDFAFKALYEAAREAGLPDNEIERTLHGALDRGIDSPREKASPPPVAIQSPAYRESGVSERVREMMALFQTGAELAANPAPPEVYIVPGLLPAGALVLFLGPPKASGKTTFWMYVLRAILYGEDFLGRRCLKSPVVYLTEQGRSSFENGYMAPANLEGEADVHVLNHYLVHNMKWEDIVEAAAAKALQVGARVIVIDTFAQYAQLVGDKENNSGDVMKAIRPLQLIAAAHNISVVLIHHDRKSGGEGHNSARGSSALPGAVDVIANLRPEDGNPNNVRKLSAIGRYSGLIDGERIELIPGQGYVPLGEGESALRARWEPFVVDEAPEYGQDGVPQKQLYQRGKDAGLPGKETAVFSIMKEMDLCGHIRLTKGEGRGRPMLVTKCP